MDKQLIEMTDTSEKHDKRGGIIGGLILILGGAMALLAQFVPDSWGMSFGLFILLGLGLAFIAAGIATREAGWFIPGGILTGIGAGVALVDGPLARLIPAGVMPGDEGGLFMLAFGGGWFLITLLTAVFSDETHWWPIIPGVIMVLIGLAAGFGGLFGSALSLLGRAWPLALIAVGVYVLYRSRREAGLK